MRHTLITTLLFCTVLTRGYTQRAFLHRFDEVHTNTRYFGFFKAAAAPDGGWALAGCDSTSGKIQVLRFDSCGDLVWSKEIVCVAAPRPTRCSDLFFDASGDLLIGSCFLDNTSGNFYLQKLAMDGSLRWARSWYIDRFGPGVYSMGMLANGLYFFTGTIHPPSGPQDIAGVLDTSGVLQSIRRYFRSSGGNATVGTALRNGHLLVRRGPTFYEIDPLSGTLFWEKHHVAPLQSMSIPLELEDGFLVVGQFSDSKNLFSCVPVFFTPHGQISSLGDMFRANGGGVHYIGGYVQFRRVAALPDGNFVTVTTDSLPTGYVSIVVFSPSGALLRQTLINPDPGGTMLLNHDFCVLKDGSLAIAANANGSLVVMKTDPVSTMLCGAMPHLYPVPYQTHTSEGQGTITVDTFSFQAINVPFTCSDFDAGQVFWCDSTAVLPDRDTILAACPGDTLWADAFYPGATRYAWENGSDSLAVQLQPGQERVATVSLGCLTFQHRFRGALKTDCPCPVLIPNAFTPNGDDQNDIFVPICNCGFVHYQLSIYNRWGQLVFTSTKSGEGWNGAFGDQPAPSDIYVYVFHFQTNAVSPTLQKQVGELALLR